MKPALMRELIALCAVSLAAAVACGGGKTTGNAVGTAKPAATGIGANTQQQASAGSADARLADALLTISDLPTGWSDNPKRSTSTSNSTLCNSINLDAKMALATGSASRSFTKGGALGPFFTEVLVTLPGSDASSYFSTVRAALMSCKQWTAPSTDSSPPTTYTGSELPLPTFGDESIAFRLTSEATFVGSVQVDLAFVRRGHTVLIVGETEIGFAALDVDQFVSLTRSADDKLRGHGIQ